jgi:sec-independent protein translocase protein TatA
MAHIFLMLGLGGQEMLLIFGALLLLFGGNKIPELMRGLGKGINEFNKARNTVEDEIRQGISDTEKKSIGK